MKNQALFSSKDKSKKLKCLLQFLFGALTVYVACQGGCHFLWVFCPKIWACYQRYSGPLTLTAL